MFLYILYVLLYKKHLTTQTYVHRTPFIVTKPLFEFLMLKITCITRAFSSIHVSGNLTWLGTNRITATSPSVPITLPARPLSCLTPLANMFKKNLAPRRIAQRHHLSIFASKGLLTEARNRRQKTI